MAKHIPAPDEQAAIDLLASRGYTTLRTGSYSRLHERVRVAEALRDAARDDAESSRRWAYNCLDEERRLRDRVEELVGFAYEHGATFEDLIAFNDRLDIAKKSPCAV